MSECRCIDAQKANCRIRDLCAVLSVPESWYYDWHRQGRAIADARAERHDVLGVKLRGFHDASAGTYGALRIHRDCVDSGIAITRRRCAELMRVHAIAGLSGREHATTTTRRARMAAPYSDLVNRDFRPAALDAVWYGDIERHEALSNHAVMKGHRRSPVAAGVWKLRAA